MKFKGLRFFCKLLYMGFYIRRNNGIIMWPSRVWLETKMKEISK